MKIPPIRSNITRFLENRKIEKEQKFLNRYVKIDTNIQGDAFKQLNSARKVMANYAKSKDVTIEITDAEKKIQKEVFEFDVDERMAERMADGKLSIKISPLKPIKTGKYDTLISQSEYVPKDTSKIHLSVKPDHIVIYDPSEGTQIVRKTKHTFEDNFLRNIYRKIETITNQINSKKIK